MKGALMTLSDKLLPRKQAIIETFNNELRACQLQVPTLWSRTLKKIRHHVGVLLREAGVNLFKCLSTVAVWQMVGFSTKIWTHLLCDTNDYAIPDLC